jgi:hypothetical protein
MLALGRITRIEKEDLKKVYLEVKLIKILGICYGGRLEDIKYDMKDLESNLEFFNSLLKWNVYGYVPKHQVI